MSTHWKHAATRCAVEGCELTRKRGWSTCGLAAHYPLGASLAGAGRIAPIPAPPVKLPYPGVSNTVLRGYAAGGSLDAIKELERRLQESVQIASDVSSDDNAGTLEV